MASKHNWHKQELLGDWSLNAILNSNMSLWHEMHFSVAVIIGVFNKSRTKLRHKSTKCVLMEHICARRAVSYGIKINNIHTRHSLTESCNCFHFRFATTSFITFTRRSNTNHLHFVKTYRCALKRHYALLPQFI